MKTLFIAAAALVVSTAADAATFTAVAGAPDGLVMTGIIEESDNIKLDAVLNYRSAQGQVTRNLYLDSPGGIVYSASAMAAAIRVNGISTVVASTATCQSSCMLMFAAGNARFIWPGAQLGVHSTHISNVEDPASTVSLAREMTTYGVPPAVVGRMVTTPAQQMTFLTPADLGSWVTMLENPAPEPVKPAELVKPVKPVKPTEQVKPTQPVKPQLVIGPTSEIGQAAAHSMTCQSRKATNSYTVEWDGRSRLKVGKREYSVSEKLRHNKTAALVLIGVTGNGDYAAIFGGPNPHISFTDGKDIVSDSCWLGDEIRQ